MITLFDFKSLGLSILIMVVAVALFIGTYLLNKNTKKPEGCEELGEACQGCKILECSHNPSKNNKEEKENKND
ncbi:MAG: hypothetical protein HUJ61_03810 [Bacilli bacterium]|nr:hypothetical protein [Bacilli bacterium]